MQSVVADSIPSGYPGKILQGVRTIPCKDAAHAARDYMKSVAVEKKQRMKQVRSMQRRIKAQPQGTAAYQALIDHKQATLNVLLSRIPDISTFAQLGELIGYSYEWVRQRLIPTRTSGYGND